MEQFFSGLAQLNDKVNTFIWVKIGVWILISTGIVMTAATKFFQVSKFRLWWRSTIGSMFSKTNTKHTGDKGAISPFQAVCTALAGTIGTGNIAGVAGAIAVGGAGAVFWMWVAAFFGMMTSYSEKVLGIYFRRRNADGEWSGGPMYYLQDGLGGYKKCKGLGKFLAVLFAAFTGIAAFGIGNMGQSNKIIANIEAAFPVKSLQNHILYGNVTLYALVIGIFLMILAGFIVLGGLQRIAGFAEKIVPFMVILFITGSLIVIGVNYDQIGPAFGAIFKTAFTPVAAAGGTFGYLLSVVITQGFKRGIFSNEAGLGSSVMVHANSNETEPVKQGMWGVFEVFTDTIIVCSMTALVILCSGVYDLTTGELAEGVTDSTLVADAFNTVFPWNNIGQRFVAVALFLFAFTTTIGWSHYGSKAIEYLFGAKGTVIYKILFVFVIMTGGLMTSSLAWDISDTFNGFMMIPNLIGVIALSPLVVRITKNYLNRKLHGAKEKPMLNFDPKVQESEEKRS